MLLVDFNRLERDYFKSVKYTPLETEQIQMEDRWLKTRHAVDRNSYSVAMTLSNKISTPTKLDRYLSNNLMMQYILD